MTSRQTKRSVVFLCFSTTLLYLLYSMLHSLLRLTSSHNFDLDHPSIFNAQFRIYILTYDCRRFTANIASAFESVVLVPDIWDSRNCTALNHSGLYLDVDLNQKADKRYKDKYSRVLEDCHSGGRMEHDGGKMKCLILEDDVVLLHDPERTREVLVQQTNSLFNGEDIGYDCTKRGFGWLDSTPTGQGSQCRIFSRPTALCMSHCITRGEQEQLDYALNDCQGQCGLRQRRFLLAVHGGLTSIMDRKGRIDSSSYIGTVF